MDANENLIRIMLISLLLYSMLNCSAAGRDLAQAKTAEAELTAEFEAIETENIKLQQSLDGRLNDAELEQLARQRLGLVMPGDKIYYFVTDREE